MDESTAAGPSPETIVDHILQTYPETDVVEAMHSWFFSLDPEKHWPNYATIVTTDEHDQASDLARDGVFRLNLGVDRETFDRIAAAEPDPEFTAADRLFPHPVYAAQRWISIVNPTETTWRETVIPLIALAHDRVAVQRARHAPTTDQD